MLKFELVVTACSVDTGVVVASPSAVTSEGVVVELDTRTEGPITGDFTIGKFQGEWWLENGMGAKEWEPREVERGGNEAGSGTCGGGEDGGCGGGRR